MFIVDGCSMTGAQESYFIPRAIAMALLQYRQGSVSPNLLSMVSFICSSGGYWGHRGRFPLCYHSETAAFSRLQSASELPATSTRSEAALSLNVAPECSTTKKRMHRAAFQDYIGVGVGSSLGLTRKDCMQFRRLPAALKVQWFHQNKIKLFKNLPTPLTFKKLSLGSAVISRDVAVSRMEPVRVLGHTCI